MNSTIQKKGRLKKAVKRFLTGLAILLALFVLTDLIWPVKTDVEYAGLITDKNGEVLHAFLTKDQQWRFKAELNELTPQLKQAIVYKEDRHFYQHPGVNPMAMVRALWYNMTQARRTSGASTISMQVIRLLEPRKRTYWNKGIEIVRAFQLELHHSKNEILQLYLNLVPYGSNIQGVKAASLIYFGKSPDQLSLAELTALSVIPNRPGSLVVGRDDPKIVAVRNKWLKRFEQDALFDKQSIADALKEPLSAARRSPPRMAPQLALRLHLAAPTVSMVQSTIDSRMQKKAEDIVRNYMNGLQLQDIHNAAVLVVDNTNGDVLVSIGSSDFLDRSHHGEVDGVRALRSPGSTLKPYLYGLSYDAGIATPGMIINDVPAQFSGYAPENYDKEFRGRVTIADALRNSLNVPAVKCLQSLGMQRFLQSMMLGGFRSIYSQRKHLGLSVILGGCTVRLEELTAMYSAFARDGIYRPLHWTKHSDTTSAIQWPIISKGATWMISQTLSELTRPDLPSMADRSQQVPKIAWKTGTSYSRRDGWSIGYNRRYTVGIWLGNFDGHGATALSGAASATPLLFRLFTALDPRCGEDWLQQPKEVETRLVCKATGLPVGAHCTDFVTDYYLPGISNTQACDHLKEIWVSGDGSYSYCTACLPANGYKTMLIPEVAPELADWYDKKGIHYEKSPPHNPACNRLFNGDAPRITSLRNGVTYVILDRETQELTLACRAAPDVKMVYWYVNDHFIKSATTGESLLIRAETQSIKISCADDKGRMASINIRVKFG